MARVPLTLQSYADDSISWSAQRLVNLYPRLAEDRGAKNEVRLVGPPGLKAFSDVTNVTRGAEMMGGVLYVVGGDKLYSVSAGGTATALGTVAGTTRVSMVAGGDRLAIATGTTGYYYTVAGGLVAITDADFLPASFVDYQDGYYIWTATDGSEFFLSSLADPTSFIATDRASASARGDLLVRAIVHRRNLWLLGEETTEVWYNSGAADFPFSRRQGTTKERGCAVGHTAIRVATELVFLGDDRVVYRSAGLEIVAISTTPLSDAFHDKTIVSDAFATAYEIGRHQFYCLHFPTGTGCYCYDFNTALWHERDSRNSGGASLGRWRVNHIIPAYGKTIGADSEDGRLHEIDKATYDERGIEIEATLIFPHISEDRMTISFYLLELDIEAGVGNAAAPGDDPQAKLHISDDGGRTYKARVLDASMGLQGVTTQRVRWLRLGASRSRVFKVTITDPVKRSIIGGRMDVGLGTT